MCDTIHMTTSHRDWAIGRLELKTWSCALCQKQPVPTATAPFFQHLLLCCSSLHPLFVSTSFLHHFGKPIFNTLCMGMSCHKQTFIWWGWISCNSYEPGLLTTTSRGKKIEHKSHIPPHNPLSFKFTLFNCNFWKSTWVWFQWELKILHIYKWWVYMLASLTGKDKAITSL